MQPVKILENRVDENGQPNVTKLVIMTCVGCTRVLGVFAQRIKAPTNSAFSVENRFACSDCGPKVAELAITDKRDMVSA